jgi:carboxyl-terminal processing protease
MKAAVRDDTTMHGNVLHRAAASGATALWRGNRLHRPATASETPGVHFSMPTRLLSWSVPPLAVLLAACGAPRASGATATPAAAIETPAACVATAPRTSQASQPAGDGAAIFDSAWTRIQRTHWDTSYNGTNWNAVRTELRPSAASARTRGELRGVLTDMVGRLRQSHFTIIPQEVSDAAPTTADSRDGGSAGLELRYLDRKLIVSAVDTGGPAWQAGVRAGWWLEAVGGCPMAARLAQLPPQSDARVTALDAYRIGTQALGGREGDTVPVTLRDAKDRMQTIPLVLAATPGTVTKFGNLPPLAAQLSWQRVMQDGRTIGVIRFNIWMPILGAQFDAAMDSLRSADAIVLDVRGNFGGVGGMALGIAGHFLDSAIAIGTMHTRGGTTRFLANPRRVDTRNRPVRPYAGPLAIVVDELSVSTSEIFAGGLKDIGRATIFGVQSAGQALPSTPERLPNGDILYHAIADFLSPTGKPVEGDGVRPDRVTPLDRRSLLNGQDAALDAAIRWGAQSAPRRPIP